jgi:hypothetical protein
MHFLVLIVNGEVTLTVTQFMVTVSVCGSSSVQTI